MSIFSARELDAHLSTKDYGPGLQKVFVVYTCREPRLSFSQRIKHQKKDKALDFDIMLDLPTFRSLDLQEKKAALIRNFLEEFPRIAEKVGVRDFDVAGFLGDLESWLYQRLGDTQAS